MEFSDCRNGQCCRFRSIHSNSSSLAPSSFILQRIAACSFSFLHNQSSFSSVETVMQSNSILILLTTKRRKSKKVNNFMPFCRREIKGQSLLTKKNYSKWDLRSNKHTLFPHLKDKTSRMSIANLKPCRSWIEAEISSTMIMTGMVDKKSP